MMNKLKFSIELQHLILFYKISTAKNEHKFLNYFATGLYRYTAIELNTE